MDNRDDIFNMSEDRQIFLENHTPKKKNKKLIYTVIAIACAVIIAVGAFLCGFFYAKGTGLSNDLPLAVEAYGYLKQYYYKDINWEEFQVLAAKGIIDSVDQFTGLYEFDKTSGTIAIGITISSNLYNRHTISTIVPDSPAATTKAVYKYNDSALYSGEVIDAEVNPINIEIGDRIYAVAINGGVPSVVEGAINSYFSKLVSSSEEISLYIQKSNGEDRYLPGYYKFDIQKTYLKTTKAFYYSSAAIGDETNTAALIRLEQFSDNACADFLQCVDKFIEEGKTKLILDLRGNGGGDSQILGFIASCLLKGADTSELNIAYYKYNAGRGVFKDTYFTTQKTYEKDNNKITAKNLPALIEGFEVSILCNGGSASCSEVLIGALQFYNGSQIIGSTTYGKGVAQSSIPLSDGKHYVLITNGKYFIPTKGINNETLWEKSIHEVGFVPSLENTITDSYRPMNKDLFIERALEILT